MPRTKEGTSPEQPMGRGHQAAEAVPGEAPRSTIDSTGRLRTTWITLVVLLVLVLALVAFLLWA
ncbi:hypothetical protein [Arenibaculum sp.]|jgi:hypothetical protein|uniref:hypothetical protein n=1 Tax=Arenibaculum sp. TaxID=2865862 RepID=UPI002E0FED4B|nr:hypothetical protein [Arenibaculum sp.]